MVGYRVQVRVGRTAGNGPQLGRVDARPHPNTVDLHSVVEASRLCLPQSRLKVARRAVRQVDGHLATGCWFTYGFVTYTHVHWRILEEWFIAIILILKMENYRTVEDDDIFATNEATNEVLLYQTMTHRESVGLNVSVKCTYYAGADASVEFTEETMCSHCG